jgi:hypothetical protein
MTTSNSISSEARMKTFDVALPELAFVAATRAIAGVGIGLLVADLFTRDRRRALGWTLLAIGALTTVPIALTVFGRRSTGR